MSAQFVSAKPDGFILLIVYYQYASRFIGRQAPSCKPAASCSA
jgi:hypothetical protein